MFYVQRGEVPHKRHTQFRKADGGLYAEELFGVEGFAGRSSLLYHHTPPTQTFQIDSPTAVALEPADPEGTAPHHHRLVNTAQLSAAGDGLSGRIPLFFNGDVTFGVVLPAEPMTDYYRNGIGDEMYYVHEGTGTLETIFGPIVYGPGDYLVLPIGTTYRLVPDPGVAQRMLWLECPSEIEPPRRYRNEYGQLLEHSPYYHRALRRRKDPDEVMLIRRAVAACEAAYARARQILRPGISEIEVYAEVQAAAVRAAGEPIGEFGNDFQSGTPGGPPRARALVAGELMPLDLAVSIRGYRGDLCRTFAVGGEPTPAQRDAHARVLQALAQFERAARPGTTCRAMDEEIRKSLDGYRGWRFPHHLGHGTGLSPHEAPRLNPRSDDSLEVGDVLAVEPGLYGPELNAGVRVEQDYLVTPDGVEPLSSFSTDL
jgi:hypothetical protein